MDVMKSGAEIQKVKLHWIKILKSVQYFDQSLNSDD